jgi:hypothetical protein
MPTVSKQKEIKTQKERKKERKTYITITVFETLTEFLIAGMKVNPEEGSTRIVLEHNTGP